MRELSCIDCGAAACDSGATRPDFCMTDRMDPATKAKAMEHYEDAENRKIMQTAAQVEYEGYGHWTRLQEIMEFASRMGYRKIGIATCVGLLSESRTLAKILRSHGFEVVGIACKAGMVEKTSLGIDSACNAIGPNICNPILQAQVLEEAGAELNVVMGLCVGHDSLFYKHAKATTTTLVTKDRVLGHNPAAALYLSGSYYRKVMGKEKQE